MSMIATGVPVYFGSLPGPEPGVAIIGAGGVPVQGNGSNSVATSYKLQQK